MAAREEIFQALFDLVSGSAKYVTKDRGWRRLEEVKRAPVAQPAIFQVEKAESRNSPAKGAPIVIFKAELVICAATLDKNVAASTVLNPLLDAIDVALAGSPSDDFRQTLGGRVYHARINGQTEIIEGNSGAHAYAIVPVELLVTN